ncbi:MAG: glycosyltransferase family 2 protein, partial [Candidatus Calescibacterium sp.]|nr:glycosyltransferase family 2 protein [Candidatus Calescibacterium sp.]
MNEVNETVCAVVVTYNRKKLLLECLEAIRRQTRTVQGIYIIDNASTDGTPGFLKENGYINELPPENLAEPWEKEFTIENLVDGQEIRVYYVRMYENTGSGGGFHEGVKRAYEKGYDWLWLMDDDGFPTRDCLEKLLRHRHIAHYIAPLVISSEDRNRLSFGLGKNIKTRFDAYKYSENDIIEGVANPFNGILIRRNIVEKVGNVLKDMFIWGDEYEYLLRVERAGYRIITVVDSEFIHPEFSKHLLHKVCGRFWMTFDPNFGLKYKYGVRNAGYVLWRYDKLSLVKHILKAFCFFMIDRRLDLVNLYRFIALTLKGIKGDLGRLDT